MSSLTVLAFSSSRCGNGSYLEFVTPVIKKVLGEGRLNIAFIPFASVMNTYDHYAEMVNTGLNAENYKIDIVEGAQAARTIEDADVIMVGGGNTFKLMYELYNRDLVERIKHKVNNGTPYVGWSAGANITGLTICTTNDMPIVQPESFKAFAFFDFQINPHYTNYTIPGHNGETRDQRLMEFLKANPGVDVVCLPEGTAIVANDGDTKYCGMEPGVVFVNKVDKEPMRRHVEDGESLSFLL